MQSDWLNLVLSLSTANQSALFQLTTAMLLSNLLIALGRCYHSFPPSTKVVKN